MIQHSTPEDLTEYSLLLRLKISVMSVAHGSWSDTHSNSPVRLIWTSDKKIPALKYIKLWERNNLHCLKYVKVSGVILDTQETSTDFYWGIKDKFSYDQVIWTLSHLSIPNQWTIAGTAYRHLRGEKHSKHFKTESWHGFLRTRFLSTTGKCTYPWNF